MRQFGQGALDRAQPQEQAARIARRLEETARTAAAQPGPIAGIGAVAVDHRRESLEARRALRGGPAQLVAGPRQMSLEAALAHAKRFRRFDIVEPGAIRESDD